MPSSYFDFKDEIKKYIYDRFSKDMRILDIGPGEGTYAQLLSDYKNIDCVEIYQPYIDTYNLTSQYKNVYNINIMDFDFEYYDIIIMGDILEHLSVEDSLKLDVATEAVVKGWVVLQNVECRWDEVIVSQGLL